MLRLVWLLFSGSGSLWVAWHRLYNCNSSYHFWSQEESPNHSWNWRCILRLRDLASKFIICEVNNGRDTSFWFDNWSPLGPLIEIFGRQGTRTLRVHIDATVADACNAQGWTLPHPISDNEVTLHTFLTSVNPPYLASEPDRFGWRTNGYTNYSFSSSKTWEILRPRAAIQAGAKRIWFSGATPKHAFHMWVTNLNRLPTRTRLVSWGMHIPNTCCLIQWSSTSSSTAPSVLRMLVVQALVYGIWQQRNNMLHNQTLIPALVFFKDINRQVINSIYALRKRKKFKSLMSLWLI
ncbi:hypothetical protein N665_0286s0032 [Sinapis alba]|nr:hypothetical protein N665_0286s0032 [Sinapis alba]